MTQPAITWRSCHNLKLFSGPEMSSYDRRYCKLLTTPIILRHFGRVRTKRFRHSRSAGVVGPKERNARALGALAGTRRKTPGGARLSGGHGSHDRVCLRMDQLQRRHQADAHANLCRPRRGPRRQRQNASRNTGSLSISINCSDLSLRFRSFIASFSIDFNAVVVSSYSTLSVLRQTK